MTTTSALVSGVVEIVCGSYFDKKSKESGNYSFEFNTNLISIYSVLSRRTAGRRVREAISSRDVSRFNIILGAPRFRALCFRRFIIHKKNKHPPISERRDVF